MRTTASYTDHRARLLDALPNDEAVLLFGAPERTRSNDTEYRYRPDSNLYWLTGFPEPGCAVFLRPGANPLTLFVRPRNPEAETWTGRRAGVEGALADFGADAAFAIDQLEKELPRLLRGVRALHYDFAIDGDNDALVMSAVAKAHRKARDGGHGGPQTFHALGKLVHELRMIKGFDEIELLRAAATLSVRAHAAAMRRAAPGLGEHQIAATMEAVWSEAGSNGAGYTPIVAGGDNATILHYIDNRDPLSDGDLLLIDAGCEVDHYTADITRTFPVSGRFSDAQREAYGWVLKAQHAAIDACRPGRSFNDVHQAAVRALTQGMIVLGLIDETLDEALESKSYRRFYMHGTSHWLGLDVHDVGAYAADGASRTLAAGMVLTVEPGLYVAADDEDAPAHLRGIGIRIEDDVLVTDGEPDVLTAALPTDIEGIERLCAESSDNASP